MVNIYLETFKSGNSDRRRLLNRVTCLNQHKSYVAFVMFNKKVKIISTSESDKKGRDETKQRGVDKFW